MKTRVSALFLCLSILAASAAWIVVTVEQEATKRLQIEMQMELEILYHSPQIPPGWLPYEDPEEQEL